MHYILETAFLKRFRLCIYSEDFKIGDASFNSKYTNNHSSVERKLILFVMYDGTISLTLLIK